MKYISEEVEEMPTSTNRCHDYGHDNQAMVHSPPSIQRRPQQAVASTTRLCPADLEAGPSTVYAESSQPAESSIPDESPGNFTYGDAHDLSPSNGWHQLTPPSTIPLIAYRRGYVTFLHYFIPPPSRFSFFNGWRYFPIFIKYNEYLYLHTLSLVSVSIIQYR